MQTDRAQVTVFIALVTTMVIVISILAFAFHMHPERSRWTAYLAAGCSCVMGTAFIVTGRFDKWMYTVLLGATMLLWGVYDVLQQLDSDRIMNSSSLMRDGLFLVGAAVGVAAFAEWRRARVAKRELQSWK